uniref:Uncharacterized protein n=1 Tax=viral metagenome TaxID=1070528 RepID=A0A6C0B266_9ZZZZ
MTIINVCKSLYISPRTFYEDNIYETVICVFNICNLVICYSVLDVTT